jgi:hypothetical protein
MSQGPKPMTEEEQLAAISERASRIGVNLLASSLEKKWALLEQAEREVDLWMNASSSILAQTTPDLKPLVKLLRSFDREIPNGTRDMLATMLDPEGEGYLGFRFSLAKTKSPTIMDPRRLDIATEYLRLHKEKIAADEMDPARSAQEEIREVYGISERTVERYAAEFRNMLQWVQKFIKKG